MGKESSRKSSGKKKGASKSSAHSRAGKTTSKVERCFHCDKALKTDDRALFVEEELSRIFCSEDCISGYFTPDVERLEAEYEKRHSKNDLSYDERDGLAHLRWITLQEPDEVWREKTLAGDYRYTLISEFTPGDLPIWFVCICLFLRGEPSFLYLAFPTRSKALVDYYRKGEEVEWVRPAEAGEKSEKAPPQQDTDRLANDWTEDETMLAELRGHRKDIDIPAEEYGDYSTYAEEVLENPDEVWSVVLDEEQEDAKKLYQFIKHFAQDSEELPPFWCIVLAKETDNPEELEIIDSFPTRDPDLVDRYRKGEQEVGSLNRAQASSGLIH